MTPPAPPVLTHGACGRTYVQRGEMTGHCGGCHLEFYGERSFDEHRRGGVCLSPADLAGWWSDEHDQWHSRPRMTEAELARLTGVAA